MHARSLFRSNKAVLFTFFIAVIFLGSCLLLIPGMWHGRGRLSPIDALFTAVSAVCVTGLTTVNTSDYTLAGQIVIMLLIQVGGLGIITFSTIYLTGPNARISFSSRQMISDYYIQSVEYDPKRILRNILFLTIGVESLGALAMVGDFRGSVPSGAVFSAMFHSVSAFCNAGFSLFPDSLEGYSRSIPVQVTIMVLIIVGGLGFVVLQDVARVITRRRHKLSLHSRLVLVATGVLIFGGAAVYLLLEHNRTFAGMSTGNRVLASLFQSITTRTAGFNTVDEAALSMPSHLMTILLMFIGGAPGSIAGGIKVTTFFLVVAAALKTRDEHAEIRLANRRLPPKLVNKATSFTIRAIGLLVTSVGLLTLSEAFFGHRDVSFIDVVFESVSAFGTVGLSLGLTPGLTVFGKLVIVGTMFAGRVGLVSLAMPNADVYRERFIEYPEGEVMIG